MWFLLLLFFDSITFNTKYINWALDYCKRSQLNAALDLLHFFIFAINFHCRIVQFKFNCKSHRQIDTIFVLCVTSIEFSRWDVSIIQCEPLLSFKVKGNTTDHSQIIIDLQWTRKIEVPHSKRWHIMKLHSTSSSIEVRQLQWKFKVEALSARHFHFRCFLTFTFIILCGMSHTITLCLCKYVIFVKYNHLGSIINIWSRIIRDQLQIATKRDKIKGAEYAKRNK